MGKANCFQAVILFLFILLLGIGSPCLGQESSEEKNWEYKEPDAPPPPNLFWISLRMIFALFFVVALIFLLVFILKKINPRRGVIDDQRPIQLLFQEQLGQKRSICLVKVFDKVLVLGVTNTQISYLSTLENDETLLFDEIMNEEPALDTRIKNAIGVIRQRLKGKRD